MFSFTWLFTRWFWSGVGLFLVLLGFHDLGKSIEFIPHAEDAVATITEVEARHFIISGKPKVNYDLTVEYRSTDGVVHSAEITVFERHSFPKEIGTEFDVSYNSNDYSDIRTDGFVKLWLEWLIKLIIGFGILFLTLFQGVSKMFRQFGSIYRWARGTGKQVDPITTDANPKSPVPDGSSKDGPAVRRR